jgi:hypothetical protein
VEGSFKRGNEPSDSINVLEIFEWLPNGRFFVKFHLPGLKYQYCLYSAENPRRSNVSISEDRALTVSLLVVRNNWLECGMRVYTYSKLI